ncbi:hypothetical protein ACVIN2_002542 [Bradyrhizobium sp. USDA 3650]
MKFILLLAFFVAPDGKTFLLQSTSSMEFDNKLACESAGAGIWDTFKASNVNAVKIVAWCIPSDAKQPSDVHRLENVGK